MLLGGFSPGEWLALLEHELLLFAGVFFLVGAVDEAAVDFVWIWLKLTGRARTRKLSASHDAELAGRAAVFIPAWREDGVIGATIRHALTVWPQSNLRLYVGCYRNDDATALAVAAAAAGDPRLRLVSEPLTTFDGELRRLIDDMFETMYDAPGIGLAEVQVGAPKRVVTADLAKKEEPRAPRVFINPEIVECSQERSVYEEGCLSIPEIHEDVERPARVRVRYLDRDDKPQEV